MSIPAYPNEIQQAIIKLARYIDMSNIHVESEPWMPNPYKRTFAKAFELTGYRPRHDEIELKWSAEKPQVLRVYPGAFTDVDRYKVLDLSLDGALADSFFSDLKGMAIKRACADILRERERLLNEQAEALVMTKLSEAFVPSVLMVDTQEEVAAPARPKC